VLVSQLGFLRDHWYPVLRSTDLGDEPHAIELFGEPWVAWRSGENVSMVAGICPHRAGRLADGWIEDGHLTCPYHGWQFDGTGQCVLMPQLDESTPIPRRARVTRAQVIERYGVVWACVGEHPVEPPVWVEAELGWRVYVEFFELWHASALRIIDNNIDLSHPAFVHRRTFGDPAQARLVADRIEETPLGFCVSFDRIAPGVATQTGVGLDESLRIEQSTEIEVIAPLGTRIRLHADGAKDYCFFGAATPVDDKRSIYVRISALEGDEDEQPYGPFHEFGTRVKEEDRKILEATPADFPIDTTSEIHLRTDRSTIEYRRYLARLSEIQPGEITGTVQASDSVVGQRR